MEEDKPLLLALVSGDIRDDEEFTDVTLAWEDGLPIEAHKAILVGWSPQTNTPIPWSKLEVCSPIRKLSVPFLGPGFVEESETLESKTKERWGLNQTQTALLQECFSSDICDRHRVVATAAADFDLTDYWILISNLEVLTHAFRSAFRSVDTCIFCGLFWRFWLKNPPSSCCMHGDKYF